MINKFKIHERFTEFMVFHKKIREDKGGMFSRLGHHKIVFRVGQGCNNGSNM